MGFFNRFGSKKTETAAASPATPDETVSAPPASTPPAPAPAPSTGVKPRLLLAREKIEAKDLPAALAIYEEILAGGAGDRADVLVAISGDLGSHGHLAEIIELVAPRYDADRHGPATGLNLLQAYLALGNADAAQHVLDILFGLNRPELEDRLHGFSNAIAELLAAPESASSGPTTGVPGDAPRIGLITVSKPVWFYGLEPLEAQILPPKEGKLRRIAFAQLALPGRGGKSMAAEPEDSGDELGRLSRAMPLWFAETFYFSPSYSPVAAIALMTPPQGESRLVAFGSEWSQENLRQLVDTSGGGLDYIVSGALRAVAGDYEVLLRVWEVKSFRERKTFTARWTPSTADSALAGLHVDLRTYMEWSPASAALAYVIPTQPRAWLDTLEASLGLFLAEKNVLPATQLTTLDADVTTVASRAASGEAASLALLTLGARASKLGLGAVPHAELARSPLVSEAKKLLG